MVLIRQQKVAPLLRYRWGVVGLLLVVGLSFWYARTHREMLTREKTSFNVKIICPRCNNEEPERSTCPRCGGKGFMWVSKDIHLPDEVIIVE